jgi:cytochrome c oxidase assembly protein subunit 15
MKTALYHYSRITVLAAFAQILIGSLAPVNGAGMGVEQGRLLLAGLTGMMVAVLFFWALSRHNHLARATLGFAGAALLVVAAQAVLGGLHAALETGGKSGPAAIGIVQACCAQIEFCLLAAVAVTLSPAWFSRADATVSGLSRIRRLAWMTFGFVFLQLVFGTVIRHLGIGLVIPTFPMASAGGGFMPPVHGKYIDIHFTHSRFLALLVAVHVLLLAFRILRAPDAGSWLKCPAVALLALLVAQIASGIFIIWTLRGVVPATLHGVSGAALLATSLILALRAGRLQASAQPGAASSGMPG